MHFLSIPMHLNYRISGVTWKGQDSRLINYSGRTYYTFKYLTIYPAI